MVPQVGISRPANISSKVLLPQPLGPMTTRNSPRRTRRLTLSRGGEPCRRKTLRSLQAGTAPPPEDALLNEAKAGIEEIAGEADHRHAEKCEVHVHHLPS